MVRREMAKTPETDIKSVSSPAKKKRPEVKKFALEDFDLVRKLGRGSFGTVFLAKTYKDNNEKETQYALKVLEKKNIRGAKHI